VIGRGTILEESFVGPVRRLRLRVPRVPRLRQVAPPPLFGEEGLIVDAALPSDQPVPAGEVWVGLRGWKILERPAPRILSAEGAEASATARNAAAELASALGGSTRVLGVAQDADEVEALGAALRARRPLCYEFHAADLLDLEGDRIDARMRRHPGMAEPLACKRGRLREALETIARSRRVVTYRDALAEGLAA